MSPKKSAIAKKQMEASMASLEAAKKFADLKPIGMMPSSQRAIDLINSNVGNYQADLDRSRDLTNESALGITQEQIDGYMNPYLQGVLNFSIKDMEDAAARRQQEQRAIASKSGNDFSSSGGTANRFQIESDLSDRSLFREIGGLSAQQRAAAYDNATRLATDERGRQAAAGGAFGNLAINTSALGAKDAALLGGAGDMEAAPLQNERDHLTQTIGNYATSTNAAQPSVKEYQKTNPLSQILGLVGTVGSIAAAPFTGGMSLGALPSMTGMASGGAGGLSNPMSSQMRPSDRRLKRNISRIGTHLLGVGWYEWDYVWGGHAEGVMADELRTVMPGAVLNIGGFDVVDYSMIGG